ncbi:hypothetical protein BS78_09G011400 [Paspalum vaginatum]|nr:hypothetical protein BS78_09G011400 [Paspalum vaginatum]
MGGGLEVDLTHGAVAVLWSSPPPGYHPVLQVADVRHVPDATGLRPAPARLQRYSLSLSDGVHSHPAVLASSLNHLGRDAELRRGCVVRLLNFVVCRDIIVLQLEILQTECPLIGNLKLYEPIRKSGGFTTTSTRYALRPDYEPYYGGQHIQQSCIASASEKSANGLSHHGPAAGGGTPSSAVVFAEAVPALWKTVGQIKDGSLGYSYMPEFITVKASISSVKIQHFRYAACPLVVNGKPCNVKATSNGDGTWRCKRCGLSFGSCNNGITVKASISSVKTQHLCYAFCPLVVNGKPCNAKATSNGDGTWRCKRCGLSFGSCNNGYSVRIQIQDHTGTAFATAYEEAADEIFGCTAKDLYTMKYKDQDYAQLNDIRHSVACKQYVFQLMKVEANPFSEGWPVECIVLKAEEVDPSAESRRLLGAIDMDLLEGLGPCFELGNSMPTWCSSPSDLKGPSTMQSSNISYAICPARSARERCLRSANLLCQQQSNGYAAKPAGPSLSALGVCGRADNRGAQTCPLDIGGHRSSAPADVSMGSLYNAGGSVGGLYGALPAKIAP